MAIRIFCKKIISPQNGHFKESRKEVKKTMKLTRREIIDRLIRNDINNSYVYPALYIGFKGYRNYNPQELIKAYNTHFSTENTEKVIEVTEWDHFSNNV